MAFENYTKFIYQNVATPCRSIVELQAIPSALAPDKTYAIVDEDYVVVRYDAENTEPENTASGIIKPSDLTDADPGRWIFYCNLDRAKDQRPHTVYLGTLAGGSGVATVATITLEENEEMDVYVVLDGVATGERMCWQRYTTFRRVTAGTVVELTNMRTNLLEADDPSWAPDIIGGAVEAEVQITADAANDTVLAAVVWVVKRRLPTLPS